MAKFERLRGWCFWRSERETQSAGRASGCAAKYVATTSRLSAIGLVLLLSVGTLWESAIADTDFAERRTLTVKGGFGVIGNAQTHCLTAVDGATCTNEKGQTPAGSFQNFRFSSMDFNNVDGTSSNSTTAELALPSTATIQAAYLYWGAWSDGTATIDGGRTDRGVVRFKTPSSAYQDVTAATTYTSLVAAAAQPCDPDETAPPADGAAAISPKVPPNLVGGAADTGYTFYQSVADVTNLIPNPPDGTYGVADIVGVVGSNAATGGTKGDNTGRTGTAGFQSGPNPRSDTNCIAGWTLVVMYEDSNETDFRSLTLFDGLVGVSNGASASTSVSGFVTPAGSYNGQFGMVAYEGDLNVTGDFFQIDGTSVSNGAASNPDQASNAGDDRPGGAQDNNENPVDDFFNSSNTRQDRTSPFTIDMVGFAPSTNVNGSGATNPSNSNQLGFDIDTIVKSEQVLGNATSALTLTFGTTSDFYLAGLFFIDVPTDVANLSISKTVDFSEVAPGESVIWTVTVNNAGPASATGVVMRDPKDANDTLTVLDNPHEVFPDGLFIEEVITDQGTCSVKDATGTVQYAAAASTTGITANNENMMVDCSLGTIAANGSVTIKIKTRVDRSFLNGAKTRSFTNVATADANEGDTVEAADDTATVVSGVDVLLAGRVWEDADSDRVLDESETVRSGFIVNLINPATGQVVATKTTTSEGRYSFTTDDVSPGTYNVQFLSAAGTTLAKAVSNVQRGETTAPGNASEIVGSITSITLVDGDNIVEQNLPLDPSGIVYNALTGDPIAGATVVISGPDGFDPAIHLAVGQQNQVTGTDGFYRFDINQAAGAPAGVYTITVTPPAAYTFVSTFIPPNPTLDVPSALVIDPLLVVTGATPDINGVTTYYLTFLFDGDDTNVVHNHIPLDPISTANTPILIAKTTPKETVVKGELVPYTITASNVDTTVYNNTSIVDTIPPGFQYVQGTATLDGVATEPTRNGRTLTWSNVDFALNESHTIQMTLVVGSGVDLGKYTNYVQVNDSGGTRVSNIAEATVIIVEDPIFDCSDIIGTVFADANGNAYQDEGEIGIPGVRVVTANGLLITTDQYGRYHVACADIPQADHGSNFILKVDERTLPAGYRLTSENPRVVRTTRGKLVKANFAAGIMKVVRVQIDGRAFKTDAPELQDQWVEKGLPKVIERLIEQGQLGVLRLVYWMDGEDQDLVDERVDWVIDQIETLWGEEEDRPPLTVEKEIRTKAAKQGAE